MLGHFRKRPPTTAQGSLAYARALLAVGDSKTALKYVRNAYYNPDIPSELEKAIVTEFEKLLTGEDYQHRMWRLVYANESNAAVRASKRLPEEYQKAAVVAGDAKVMGDPEAWWTERPILARHSVGKNHRDATQTGYQIAKSHGLSKGWKAAEGEFLAGWIALRHRGQDSSRLCMLAGPLRWRLAHG